MIIIRLLLITILFYNLTCFGRLNFIHIPKCGGTTIHSQLEKYFYVDEIYPVRKSDRIFHFHDLKESESNCLLCRNPIKNPKQVTGVPAINHEFTSGHLPLWFLENYDLQFDDSFTFTLLRSPIQRILSEYFYKKKYGLAPENISDITPNIMCRMLCSNPALEGDELLEDCKQNIHKLDMVLLLENIDDEIGYLYEALSIPKYELSTPIFNDSKRTEELINKDEIERIRKDNYLDIQLYEYAKINRPPFKKTKKHMDFLTERLNEQKKCFEYTVDMPAFQKGWYHREYIGTGMPVSQWCRPEGGSLFFRLCPGIDYEISLDVLFLVDKSSFRFYVNNREITLKERASSSYTILEGIIPAAYINDSLTELFFFHPQSIKPQNHFPGSVDSRDLSIGLQRMRLKSSLLKMN